MMKISHLASAAMQVLMPRTCAVCQAPLQLHERYLCKRCMAGLPRTHYEEVDFNAFEQLLAGKVPVERCTAYFFYQRSDPYAAILHDIKYRNMPRLGTMLTARAVEQMRDSGFFDSVEAVVPVPLHYSKRAARGYNQSEYLARGIARATKAPVVKALKAVREHSTQTHKDAVERLQNIRGTFALNAKQAAKLQGRHILLVDDVVTTGATLIECAQQLVAIPGVKISVFTLAAAQLA